METRKISIYELKPAEYNPRIMPSDEMDKLTTSLRTFGLVDPIIIDLTDNNTIIGGHQRYEALMHLDEEELTLIPLGDIGLVINETEIRIKDKNDQKAMNLALNKITGEFDYNQLNIIFNDLLNDGYNIELTGFDEKELLNIEPLNIELDNIKDNQKQETPKKTRENTFKDETKTDIQKGDLFQLGKHRLICGDSTKEETYKKLFFDNTKADITFTSPPYNTMQTKTKLATDEQFKYYNKEGVYSDYTDSLTNEEYSNLLINSCKNALNYSDDVYYNIGILRGSKIGITNLLHHFQNNFSDILVWQKNNSIPLGLITQQHKVSHICELIFCFNQTGNRDFTHSQWKKGTKNNLITTGKVQNNPYVKQHKATFPIDLPLHIIDNFTNKSILDNFAGTGTTLIASEKRNKTSYNIEQSPKLCQTIINRWQEHTGEKAETI